MCLQRDRGFEQQYRDALTLVTKSRRDPGSINETVLELARTAKASGEGDAANSTRRMTLFHNEFSKEGSPSRDVVLRWTSANVSRVFWNANVLFAMGFGWLVLTWLVLKFGRPIRSWLGPKK